MHKDFERCYRAVQQAGFRACKRCRPDTSRGSLDWNVHGDVVASMRLITDSIVDRKDISVLAAHTGSYATHPKPAWLLIETTVLPFGDVAFAAGFSSI
nr:hypothetical protein [Mycobacterium uberis]